MILTYSKIEFIDLILSGQKIHTIRTDETRRWKAGMPIQHWSGNPRNTRAKNKPREFAKGVCSGVQPIQIECTHRSNWGIQFRVIVGLKVLSVAETIALARNDGLTLDEFAYWFLKDQDVFVGRIVHFTEKKY